jgi:hypothetical protein
VFGFRQRVELFIAPRQRRAVEGFPAQLRIAKRSKVAGKEVAPRFFRRIVISRSAVSDGA